MSPHLMKRLSIDDRPREKLMEKGAEVLSDSELLALLVGSGNRKENAVELSRRVLSDAGQDLRRLGQWSLSRFLNYSGLGEAKAVKIMAAMELGRRWQTQSGTERLKIGDSQAAYQQFLPHLGHLGHEEFWALYLDQGNRVLHKMRLGKGGWTGTVADVRQLFKEALHQQATGVIVAHNHPSGELKPSKQDQMLTNKAREAGKILDIHVLDHLIVAGEGYYSFSDNGA